MQIKYGLSSYLACKILKERQRILTFFSEILFHESCSDFEATLALT